MKLMKQFYLQWLKSEPKPLGSKVMKTQSLYPKYCETPFGCSEAPMHVLGCTYTEARRCELLRSCHTLTF